jgi:protein TonB
LFVSSTASYSLQSRGPERIVALAVVVALHLGAIALLLTYQPVREALVNMAPIVVGLVTPPKAPEVTPVTEPPKPLPVVRPRPQPVRKPVELPKVITAPSEARSAFVAPAPTPDKPLPPVDAAPDPGPPAQIVPPRFNADYLQNPAPPYPPIARRMREEGRVVLRVLVSPAGSPDKVELKASSGSARLDESALSTVKTWKFIPARQGDQPVAAWVLVPISFSLQG